MYCRNLKLLYYFNPSKSGRPDSYRVVKLISHSAFFLLYQAENYEAFVHWGNNFIFVLQISKMKKKSNLICVFISLLPIILLFFYYNSLGQYTNTKISGSNGMIISRSSFIFVIVGLSVLWYYVSILISQRLIGLNSLISQVGLRSLINLLFSVLSILLILSNLK
jgi:hypothetical protein